MISRSSGAVSRSALIVLPYLVIDMIVVGADMSMGMICCRPVISLRSRFCLRAGRAAGTC